MVFGLAGTVIALVNPYAERVFDFIDNKFIDRVAVLIFIAMAADFTMTIMSWRNLNISLMKIHNILNEKLEKTMEGVSQKAILIEEKYKDGIVVYGKSLNKLLSIPIKKREMRFLKAFPGLKPIKYSAVVDRIREEIIKHKNNLSS